MNLLSVPLMIVTYAIVLLRGGFDVILEHFWIYWAGMLAAIACLIPHEFIHAMCFRKEAYIYTNLKNGMLFVVAPEDMSKSHFIVMSLMPNLIFGFVPFLLYLIFRSWDFWVYWERLPFRWASGTITISSMP